jgi:osmotically-inducible protein OsmY
MAPTNEELIKQNVVEQLVWDDSVDANNIRVNAVSGGIVMLEGVVSSYAEKIAAGDDVFEVPGVKHVENNLEVIHTETLMPPDDEEITEKISNTLQWNSKIESAHIHVETINRFVTLRGTVATYWEKYEAEKLANRSNEVKGVVNLLKVRLTNKIIDKDIENDIKRAFKRNILIDEKEIRVKSENGTVQLSGSVKNYLEKLEAIDIAIYTKGVVDVVDKLLIEND